MRVIKKVMLWLNESRAPVFLVAVGSLIWLAVIVPFLSLHNDGIAPFFSAVNKGNQDLANYYMAGAMVLAGDFDSLYPVPRENIQHNVGWPGCADSKPGYTKVASEKGVEESFRFILPPPSALLFVPLAMLPYPFARWVWVIFLGLSCWGTCALACRLGRNCGCPQWISLAFWCFWAFSPFVMKGLRTGNSTPVLALFTGLTAWGVWENRAPLASASCIVSGLLKGVSLIFLPLILVMKRWSIVAWGVVLTVLINGLTVFLGGWGAYREFFESVYPSTQIIDQYIDNQSVYGFLYRVFGDAALQPAIIFGLKTLGVFLELWILWITVKNRRKIQHSFQSYLLLVVVSLGLFLVFKPYNWGHYAMCFIPFWPALFALCRKKWQRSIVWISAVTMWFPLVEFHGKQLISSGWLTSPVFVGEILLIALSLVILVSPTVDDKK